MDNKQVFVTLFVVLVVLAVLKWDWCEFPLFTGTVCAECNAKVPRLHAQHAHLDDIFNPLFNVRQAATHMLLLEDHLNTPDRRCDDCIQKHMLIIEGFLDEAINLDRHGRHTALLLDKPAQWKAIERKFMETKDYLGCSQDIRPLRKKFIGASFKTL